MALDKDKLKSDLKAWFLKGKDNEFPSISSGVSELKDIIEAWGSDGADSFGNKLQAFTASELQSALSSLSNSETPDEAAEKLAEGATDSFKDKNLEDSSQPPMFFSTVSHKVVSVTPKSTIETKFKSLLNEDFNALADGASSDDSKPEYLADKLADKWSDIFMDAAEGCSWSWDYLQNIPPVFPPSNVSGNIA
jgi:hypothetical protein